MTEDHSKTFISQNAGDLLTDWGELALDQFLDDGLLKDIPFLGSLLKIYKSGVNVKEYLFSKKVEKFLKSLSGVTTQEAKSFNDKINSDPKFKTRVAEHLTLLLDRLDDIEKSELLAKAFSVFIMKAQDFDRFRRIARAIERCMIDDIKKIHVFNTASDAHSDITYDLAACGLIELVQLPQVSGTNAKPVYKITAFGMMFDQLILA